MRYTFGIATREDKMLWATVHAALTYHPFLREADCEVLVVDNSPEKSVLAADFAKHFKNFPRVRYLHEPGPESSCLWKQRLFQEGRGDVVSSCDSHVMFEPGGLLAALEWCEAHPLDMVMGPCLSGYGVMHGTNQMIYEWEPYELPTNAEVISGVVCRGDNVGAWVRDPRAMNPDGEPFEIQQQGTGFFMMRRENWPGFLPSMRGFGGNETYLMEAVRAAGGRVICHPRARWLHSFVRDVVPYKLPLEDKVRNYLAGFVKLGRADLYEAISAHVSRRARHVVTAVQRKIPSPTSYDALAKRMPKVDGGTASRELIDALRPLLRRGQRTLELGSGLTTLLFNAIGTRHLAVEQSKAWVETMSDLAPRCEVLHAPLNGDGWYSWRPNADEAFDVVVVDGPSKVGRSLLLEHARDAIAGAAYIIVDDTNRPEEAQLAASLERELDMRRRRVRPGARHFDLLTRK